MGATNEKALFLGNVPQTYLSGGRPNRTPQMTSENGPDRMQEGGLLNTLVSGSIGIWVIVNTLNWDQKQTRSQCSHWSSVDRNRQTPLTPRVLTAGTEDLPSL